MRLGGTRDQSGFSLVEVVTMLSVSLLLATALSPVAKTVTDRARLLRATTDGEAIRDAILRLLNDTNKQAIKTQGETGSVVEILVSDGDIPREVSATGDPQWQPVVNNATGLVDFLERHLVTNNPRGNPANGWDVPGGLGGNGWRGAYLTAPIDPDPWGNRYAVNVKFLGAPKPDVVVLSAGPNEIIDTAFAVDGLVAGDDDIVVLVEA